MIKRASDMFCQDAPLCTYWKKGPNKTGHTLVNEDE